ncbi:MAG TPA: DUF892 family protein [Gemmatimonadota bacterium]|nr:DUF892 family protein [Gemmatimonadota bacterium]
MTAERASARERYRSGLESLLALELQTEALIPTMAAYAGCDRLRRFFDDLPPMIRRQRRRLELLLNAFPERTDTPTVAARPGLEEELREIGSTPNPAERDTELITSAAWIIGLQIEQYGATRDLAIGLGDFEAARHLQRSLNTVGALSLRLFRVSRRLRQVAFDFPLLEVSDFDRLPAFTGALP